jgi:hypothetical protein
MKKDLLKEYRVREGRRRKKREKGGSGNVEETEKEKGDQSDQ